MPTHLSRRAYAAMFGPTTGDRVRLADTELFIRVEMDFTIYGEEVKFGGGKVIRDGMGQSQATRASGTVYVLGKDNVVTPRPVTLGRSLGDMRVIRDGLKPTDRVVINGIQKIRPGAKVTPVEGQIPEPAAGTAAAVSQ